MLMSLETTNHARPGKVLQATAVAPCTSVSTRFANNNLQTYNPTHSFSPFPLSPTLPFSKAGRDHARFRVKTDTGRSYFHTFAPSPSSWPLETFAGPTGAEAPRPTAGRFVRWQKRQAGKCSLPADLEATSFLSGDFPQRGQGLGAFQRGRSERQAKVSQALTFLPVFGSSQKSALRRGRGVLDLCWLFFFERPKKNEPQISPRVLLRSAQVGRTKPALACFAPVARLSALRLALRRSPHQPGTSSLCSRRTKPALARYARVARLSALRLALRRSPHQPGASSLCSRRTKPTLVRFAPVAPNRY
jgi:hypothetical protein